MYPCRRTSLSFRQIVQLFSPKDKTWNLLSKIKSKPNSISYFRFSSKRKNFIITWIMQKWDMQNKMWLCGLWTDTKRLILLKNIRQIGVIYTLLFQRNDQKYVDSTLRVKNVPLNFFAESKFLKIQNFFGSSGQVQSRLEGLS